MEATPKQLDEHAQRINAFLQELCGENQPAPLVRLDHEVISLATSCPTAIRRDVTTDLGLREIALQLPIPNSKKPRFWIGLHEKWEWTSKHRLRFVECGLRVYFGERSEEPVQFLRLEWVAPDRGRDGVDIYHGAHAAHPHWHVDSSALIGQEDYIRSLETLTAPNVVVSAEEFNENSVQDFTPARQLFDFSWIQFMHFPAQAQWMHKRWDGKQMPGPHQSEPATTEQLFYWWCGALKYLLAELPR
jgi:hypothetical protein